MHISCCTVHCGATVAEPDSGQKLIVQHHVGVRPACCNLHCLETVPDADGEQTVAHLACLIAPIPRAPVVELAMVIVSPALDICIVQHPACVLLAHCSLPCRATIAERDCGQIRRLVLDLQSSVRKTVKAKISFACSSTWLLVRATLLLW